MPHRLGDKEISDSGPAHQDAPQTKKIQVRLYKLQDPVAGGVLPDAGIAKEIPAQGNSAHSQGPASQCSQKQQPLAQCSALGSPAAPIRGRSLTQWYTPPPIRS